MSEGAWFARLDLVHRIRGRARLRYRCRRGTPGAAIAIERAVENLPGVVAARVNPRADALVVNFDDAVTDVETLCTAIRRLSPLAVPAKTVNGDRSLSSNPVLRSLANLLAGGQLPPALRMPMALGSAAPLLRHAAGDLVEQGINSHVLEALAVLISLARRDFAAANTTTFMLALGEYMEDSIARRSDDLLKHLLRPASDQVWIERDGVEEQIPNHAVSVGDRVVVSTGTVIPVDGTVLGGVATVNEAAT